MHRAPLPTAVFGVERGSAGEVTALRVFAIPSPAPGSDGSATRRAPLISASATPAALLRVDRRSPSESLVTDLVTDLVERFREGALASQQRTSPRAMCSADGACNAGTPIACAESPGASSSGPAFTVESQRRPGKGGRYAVSESPRWAKYRDVSCSRAQSKGSQGLAPRLLSALVSGQVSRLSQILPRRTCTCCVVIDGQGNPSLTPNCARHTEGVNSRKYEFEFELVFPTARPRSAHQSSRESS